MISALGPDLHPGRHPTPQKQCQPQPLRYMFRTTGGLVAELLILIGQIRRDFPRIGGFIQRRFF